MPYIYLEQMPKLRQMLVKTNRLDQRSKQLAPNLANKKRTQTGGLEQQLVLKETAQVRLVDNIDVSDGLVNGVTATVEKIIHRMEGRKKVVDCSSQIRIDEFDENNSNVCYSKLCSRLLISIFKICSSVSLA